jgi:uncharacterized membrane protein YdjX (TVP38/TMEM64 family)
MGDAIKTMRRLIRFILNMDARAWRTALVIFLLAGGAGFIVLLAVGVLGFEGKALVQEWLGFAAQSRFALLIAIAAFAVLAFLGVPQVALIAAAMVAFGPVLGFLYSWLGTMVSASIGFWLGRMTGAGLLDRFAGEGVRRFVRLIARNGFLSSLVVRLVPAAPFVAINMAAGVTRMNFASFLAGTAIGIIPKIVLTIAAGASVVSSVVRAGPGALLMNLALLVLVLAAWLGAGLLARRWIQRKEDEAEVNT